MFIKKRREKKVCNKKYFVHKNNRYVINTELLWVQIKSIRFKVHIQSKLL